MTIIGVKVYSFDSVFFLFFERSLEFIVHYFDCGIRLSDRGLGKQGVVGGSVQGVGKVSGRRVDPSCLRHDPFVSEYVPVVG